MPREVSNLIKKIVKVNVELMLFSVLITVLLKQYMISEMLIVGNVMAIINLILNTVAFPKIFKDDDEESKAAKKTKMRYVLMYMSKVLLFIILVINIKIDKIILIPLVCGYVINLIAIVITVFKAGYKTTQ